MADVEDLTALSNTLVQAQPDFFRELLKDALREVMETEVSALTGATHGERSEARLTQRNGYRSRALETRMGTVNLEIPRLRKGSYYPSFLAPRRRWEKAFVNVVSEAYVLGVSTRKVEDLMEAMGAQGVKRSEVSRMSQMLDREVEVFRNRHLGEKAHPYVWLDAIHIKTRDHGRVVSKAVLIAIGVTETGERQVLGIEVAQKEMASSWSHFLEGLVTRGLRGVQLVVSDAHAGLRAAIPRVMNGCTWQRCSVHFLRNVLSVIPRKAQQLASASIRHIFHQASIEDAKLALGRAVELLEPKWPRAAELLLEAEEDVLAYMHFPEAHWRQLKSTNPLERLNKEIRRRTDVVGIFPTDASILRLVGMLMVEHSDEWEVGRRYFSLASMAKVTGADHVPPRALERL